MTDEHARRSILTAKHKLEDAYNDLTDCRLELEIAIGTVDRALKDFDAAIRYNHE